MEADKKAAQLAAASSAAPPSVDAMLYRQILTTPEVWNKVVAAGVAKSKFSWIKKILLSFLAGCYLSFGMAFAFIVGGQLTTISKTDPGMFNLIYGFFGLPFGLTMIILMGSELFTSDVMFMCAAWFERKVQFRAVTWNLIWCFFGNLCGSLFMVQMFIWGEVFTGRESWERNLSIKKTSFGFGVTYVRAILCNWLVNIGVWQALSAQDVAGKFVGVFIPITIFVACGFEHCIANMFGVPMGMRLFSGVGVNEYIQYNLVPATMGNFTSAFIFLACFYFMSFGSGESMFVRSWNNLVDRVLPARFASWLYTGEVNIDDRRVNAGKRENPNPTWNLDAQVQIRTSINDDDTAHSKRPMMA